MTPQRPTPTNADEARILAAEYVASQLARGYTVADAQRESYSGMSGPGIPGWLISRGRITVPSYGEPSWTFVFADLLPGEPQQLSLF